MSKIAVVFWSGTGNTEAMANAVAEGVKSAGAEVSVMVCTDFSSEQVKDFDAIAFGCPAMGNEVLEEYDFQPMFDTCVSALSGKRIALFGSYGWGNGEWMSNWENVCGEAGANLVCESVTCLEAPDNAAVEACRALGAALVG